MKLNCVLVTPIPPVRSLMTTEALPYKDKMWVWESQAQALHTPRHNYDHQRAAMLCNHKMSTRISTSPQQPVEVCGPWHRFNNVCAVLPCYVITRFLLEIQNLQRTRSNYVAVSINSKIFARLWLFARRTSCCFPHTSWSLLVILKQDTKHFLDTLVAWFWCSRAWFWLREPISCICIARVSKSSQRRRN
jgi:hypothetical protein